MMTVRINIWCIIVSCFLSGLLIGLQVDSFGLMIAFFNLFAGILNAFIVSKYVRDDI